MAKVLKITRQDKTIHIAPLSNKAFLTSFNNRQPAEKRMKIEEVDEEDAKNLPYIDEAYVSAADAQKKVSDLTKEVSDKDAEIAKLKEMLANSNAGEGEGGTGKKTAVEVIALINAVTKPEDIIALIEGDTRATVNKAAEEKIAKLKAGE
jgi:hypothetical protein